MTEIEIIFFPVQTVYREATFCRGDGNICQRARLLACLTHSKMFAGQLNTLSLITFTKLALYTSLSPQMLQWCCSMATKIAVLQAAMTVLECVQKGVAWSEKVLNNCMLKIIM